MARCSIATCDWKGKKDGVPIHLALAHGIHPVHDEVSEDPLDGLLEALRAEVGAVIRCPVPGCAGGVKDLERHLEAEHEDWRRSDGRWVFEA